MLIESPMTNICKGLSADNDSGKAKLRAKRNNEKGKIGIFEAGLSGKVFGESFIGGTVQVVGKKEL